MDMLCFIAFAETSDDTDIEPLKTEITTLTEKQFSSSNIKYVIFWLLFINMNYEFNNCDYFHSIGY